MANTSPSSDAFSQVAIIGAGLGGCALALALSQHSIPVQIYESRSAHDTTHHIPSGVILTPNGLHVLSQLGVYPRIASRCYIATHRIFTNDANEITRKTRTVDESICGYAGNHRIWRSLLLEEMKLMLSEKGVQIEYGSRLTSIEPLDPRDGGDVSFTINDTETHATPLLLAADGINSTVRDVVTSPLTIRPEYTGTLGLLAHIPRESITWPSPEYPLNATIQSGPGALFFLPEDPEARDIMVGLQVQYPLLCSSPAAFRAALRELKSSTEALTSLYHNPTQYKSSQNNSKADEPADTSTANTPNGDQTRGESRWGPLPQLLIKTLLSQPPETFLLWPYMRTPRLVKWYSPSHQGRVVILGDAAHALPPGSGQGVNQVLEDVHTLLQVITSFNERMGRKNGREEKREMMEEDEDDGTKRWMSLLDFWQEKRQKTIERIFEWATEGQNVARMGKGEREGLMKERERLQKGKGGEKRDGGKSDGDDMSWLYAPQREFGTEVEEWWQRRGESGRCW